MKLLNTLATLGVASGILASAPAFASTQLSSSSAAGGSNSGSSFAQMGVENGIVTIQKLGGSTDSATTSTSDAAGVATDGDSGSASTAGSSGGSGAILASNHAEGTSLPPVGDSGNAGSTSTSDTGAAIVVETVVETPVASVLTVAPQRQKKLRATAKRPIWSVSRNAR
mgnify:CR=1 FL=1